MEMVEGAMAASGESYRGRGRAHAGRHREPPRRAGWRRAGGLSPGPAAGSGRDHVHRPRLFRRVPSLAAAPESLRRPWACPAVFQTVSGHPRGAADVNAIDPFRGSSVSAPFRTGGRRKSMVEK
jgi:hypothetical protein